MREEFDGMLELLRLGLGVKDSMSDLELFTEHNKRMMLVHRRLEDVIYWYSSLYSQVYGLSRETLVASKAVEASNLPYNVRSAQSLYLTYLSIQRGLINDLNAFSEDQGNLDLIETVYFAIDRLENVIDNQYKYAYNK
jgi:hypothetical protein